MMVIFMGCMFFFGGGIVFGNEEFWVCNSGEEANDRKCLETIDIADCFA